ncbi:MAG: type IV pilus assembly protein PilM [Minisyncoccales bacterium]|jgi:type IV pilus assembly protein PilM
MFKIPFFRKSERHLGIDIGTSSVKAVELSYSKKGTVLQNYGERINKIDKKDLEGGIRKKAFFASDREVADSIKDILNETKIGTKEAIFSIPDFMSFFTVFTTPPMPKEEIASVVRFEARQHIPLPLQEMTLDWSLIDNDQAVGKDNKKKELKILLVAVPNKTILKYQKVAEMAGIKVAAIEAEVFSLARAVIGKEDINKTIQLIDLGVQSTTITIVKSGIVRSTYSIDFAVGEIVKELADNLEIDYNEAEELIKDKGIDDQKIGSFLRLRFSGLASESKQVSDNYFRNEKKEIDKVIVGGGAAQMSGLAEFLKEQTQKETEIANPFLNIVYPPILEPVIKDMSPRYSVAVGLALRYIENKK